MRRAYKTRMKGYEDVKINEGDLVFYQYQDKNAGLRSEKMFSINGSNIFMFCKWYY